MNGIIVNTAKASIVDTIDSTNRLTIMYHLTICGPPSKNFGHYCSTSMILLKPRACSKVKNMTHFTCIIEFTNYFLRSFLRLQKVSQNTVMYLIFLSIFRNMVVTFFRLVDDGHNSDNLG